MRMFLTFTFFWALSTLILLFNLWNDGYLVRAITVSASMEITAKTAWVCTVAYYAITYFTDKWADKLQNKLENNYKKEVQEELKDRIEKKLKDKEVDAV